MHPRSGGVPRQLLAAASTHDVQHVVREYGPDLLTRDVRAAFHARFMVQFGAGGRAE